MEQKDKERKSGQCTGKVDQPELGNIELQDQRPKRKNNTKIKEN